MRQRRERPRRLVFEPLEERQLLASDFTVALLPDTQNYAESYPSIFHAQTQWLAEQSQANDIVFVSHVGDVVDNPGTLLEWERADAAMGRLDGDPAADPNGLVPYAVVPGNHDYDSVNKHSGAQRFTTYFGASRYAGRGWYGGSSPNQLNHYQLFSAGGRQFLHIALEWEPRDSAITWAQGVLDAHADVPTIVTTHAYLYRSGGRFVGATTADGRDGEQIFQDLVAPNPQIFMVMGGHFLGESHQVSLNHAGTEVLEILADYQGRPNGGNGWMQLFTFRPDLDRIDVTTYSPSLDQYEIDASSQFTVNVDFDQRLGFNTPPLAADETYDADFGGVLQVAVDDGVLTNDADPDGDPLVAEVVAGPDHGTAIVASDGSFAYTPDAGFFGVDQFTYRAHDGRLHSDVATVTVRVTDHLGPVDFLEMADLDPSAADRWCRFSTKHEAFLTLEARLDGPADGAQLTLYDEDLVELAGSTPVDGTGRIDWQAGPGQTYYLKLSATGSDVDLRLANLVGHVGTTLTVHGTNDADAFEFDATGPPLLTINGLEYRFDEAEVTSATFDGGQGGDTAALQGNSAAETAELWPGHATLYGAGYTVTAADVESVTISGGGGTDVAFLHDDPNQADTFQAQPETARLYGPQYDNRVESFRYVHAYGTTGNNDVAFLYDDPHQNDVFQAWPHMARLYGAQYYNRVKSFRYVHAYGTTGNADVAFLYDDPHQNDTFQAWPHMARLYGAQYYNRVKSFRYVHAYGTTGNADVAFLRDSNGNDVFQAWPHMARLYGAGFYNRVRSFRWVHAYATGGTDVAELYGSGGNDAFLANSENSRLYGSGFYNRANAFDEVEAYGAGGTDVAEIHDAALETGLTLPADAGVIAWLYDFDQIREIDDQTGEESTLQAADQLFTACWL